MVEFTLDGDNLDVIAIQWKKIALEASERVPKKPKKSQQSFYQWLIGKSRPNGLKGSLSISRIIFDACLWVLMPCACQWSKAYPCVQAHWLHFIHAAPPKTEREICILHNYSWPHIFLTTSINFDLRSAYDQRKISVWSPNLVDFSLAEEEHDERKGEDWSLACGYVTCWIQGKYVVWCDRDRRNFSID